MTVEEFNKTGWSKGMNCLYQGKKHQIRSLDFDEKLVGIVVDHSDDPAWVRCENITVCA